MVPTKAAVHGTIDDRLGEVMTCERYHEYLFLVTLKEDAYRWEKFCVGDEMMRC